MKCSACRLLLNNGPHFIIKTDYGSRFGWHFCCTKHDSLYKEWMNGSLQVKNLVRKIDKRGPDFVDYSTNDEWGYGIKKEETS